MNRKILLLLTLFIAAPVWAQVQPSATGDIAPIEDDNRMTVPPVASGMLFSNVPTSDERTNFVEASVTTNAAYTDNILPSSTAKPVSDVTVSVLPSFAFNRLTPRQQTSITYLPSFTFYKNSTGLNAGAQGANGMYQIRLSPHISLALQDAFLKTSNIFNTQFPFTAGGINGSTSPAPALVIPFAEQIRNDANGALSYQFSSKAMVGGSGFFSNYRFPDKANSPGVYDSDGLAGAGFYNRRLSRTQYLGVMYKYSDVLAYPPGTRIETQIHALLPFYTLSFNRNFSLSVSGGAQHVLVAQKNLIRQTAWSPQAIASFSWQGNRGSLIASYLHTTTAGQGLLGAYNSNSGNVSGLWKIARTWSVTAALAYQATDAAIFVTAQSYQGGYSVMGNATLEHPFGDHVTVSGEFDRLHQEYTGLAIIAANPDSNRESFTVTYRFTKSLGR
jgi:hypothetical protein